MNTNQQNSLSLNRFEGANAGTAPHAQESASAQLIPPTLGWPTAYTLNLKDGSPLATELNLQQSNHNIPNATSEYCSLAITGLPKLNENDIHSGRNKTASKWRLAKRFLPIGQLKYGQHFDHGTLGVLNSCQYTYIGPYRGKHDAFNSTAGTYETINDGVVVSVYEPEAIPPEPPSPTPVFSQGLVTLKEQVGGSHYRKFKIQPIEYIQANGLSFLAGNVCKYITRYKDKGGLEDIKKVIHYCQLIAEFEYGATL